MALSALISCGESDSDTLLGPKDAGGESSMGGAAGGAPSDSGSDASGGTDAGDGATGLPRLGVFTVKVDGSNLALLIDTGGKQLTHVRKGPGDWLTATRYTEDIDKNGLAMEGEGGTEPHYGATEVVLLQRSTPGAVTPIAGGTPGRLCANSSFTQDGKLLYLHQDDPTNAARPRFKRATFTTLPSVASTSAVDVPAELFPVDPFQSGTSDGSGFIVFPAIFQHPTGFMRPIWQMPATGTTKISDVKVVGCPLCPANSGCCAFPTLAAVVGTNDPIVHPQGTHVAWMQQEPNLSFPVGSIEVHPYRQSVAKLGEPQTNISPASTPPTTIQSYMQWRLDGGELVYWEIQIDFTAGIVKQPLFRMAPDGSGRQAVPLPAALCASHPSYLDHETIVFSGWRCGGSPCSCAADKL